MPELTRRDRARGALLGALVGDALGSMVEFMSAAEIARRYPGGLRSIGPSPVWGTLAGQPTDDGELTLTLARSLLKHGDYAPLLVRDAYYDWAASDPFDIGGATAAALVAGRPDPASQANGALMRQAPLAIWAAGHADGTRAGRAMLADTRLTHPSPVCIAASGVHLGGLVAALRDAPALEALATVMSMLDQILEGPSHPDLIWAAGPVRAALVDAGCGRAPETEGPASGWVLVALQNAWYQALHAETFEEGLVDTVRRGGDTDTNACIAGALLGALHGEQAIPIQWRQAVLTCQPQAGAPGVRRPRPPRYWPVDARELADRLSGEE